MPEIDFPKDEQKGLIHCKCGKCSPFGRVDTIEQRIHTTLIIHGECGECLDKRADDIETAKVKDILSAAVAPPVNALNLTPNENANPNPTPANNGSQENKAQPSIRKFYPPNPAQSG